MTGSERAGTLLYPSVDRLVSTLWFGRLNHLEFVNSEFVNVNRTLADA